MGHAGLVTCQNICHLVCSSYGQCEQSGAVSDAVRVLHCVARGVEDRQVEDKISLRRLTHGVGKGRHGQGSGMDAQGGRPGLDGLPLGGVQLGGCGLVAAVVHSGGITLLFQDGAGAHLGDLLLPIGHVRRGRRFWVWCSAGNSH